MTDKYSGLPPLIMTSCGSKIYDRASVGFNCSTVTKLSKGASELADFIHKNLVLIYLMKGLQFLYSNFKDVEENASSTLLSTLSDYALHKIDKNFMLMFCILEGIDASWRMHGKPTKVAWQRAYVRH